MQNQVFSVAEAFASHSY